MKKEIVMNREEQAFQIVDAVCAKFCCNRRERIIIEQSLKVLLAMVRGEGGEDPKAPPDKDSDEKEGERK